jgi:hypothetical protein
MTLFDVEELTLYWADHPPTHLMVAAYLGIGPKPKEPIADTLPLNMPGLGPMRPFSAAFGSNAADQIRELWSQFETAKASKH